MMLTILIVIALVAHLILDPVHSKSEYRIIMIIVGCVFLLVGIYNLVLAKGLINTSWMMLSGSCLAGGGLWPSVTIILGVVLIAASLLVIRKKHDTPVENSQIQ